jgi:DNA-binding HxlR family transcriptional regulator
MNIEREIEMTKVNGKLYPCSTSLAMAFIGGKWKAAILYHLKDREKRYHELRKEMPTITERTLSLQLKQLEDDGLISRNVFTQKPPLIVIYKLTTFGKSSIDILDAITEWGNKISEEKGEIVYKSFLR